MQLDVALVLGQTRRPSVDLSNYRICAFCTEISALQKKGLFDGSQARIE